VHAPDFTLSKSLVQTVRRLLLPPAGTRLIPPAGTLVLCFLTVGAFIGQSIAGGERWIRAAGAVYTSVPEILPVTRIGDGQAIPVWLTLFTYMFLHGGWWHLLSNVVVVWCVGALTEPVLGTSRFVLAYLACGVTGALAVGVVFPHSLTPAFGASLAYCGVIGAYAAFRLPHTIRSGGQVLILVLEATTILLVGAWFGVRTIRADWEGSLMFHFLPFMVAWFSVRIWNGLGYVRVRRTRTR
jgi:membrane associated rhomboid family serine protease